VPAEGEKVLHLHPEDLVTLAPRLKPFLRSSDPTWPEIVDAADWLRRDLDVSKPLWGEACRELGRVPAAIAVAIVSTKEEGYFRTSSGGYFHGMVEKAKRGELHLERTLWGLRRGAQPAGSPPAERDGVPRRGESQGPWS
jgi:replication initiation protein RepC